MKNEQEINSNCCRPIVLLHNSSNYLSKNHAILCLSFLILLHPPTIVTAQSGRPAGPQQQYPYARFSPTMAIIIVLVIAILFFMGFFSIYVRHCGGGGGASMSPALSLRSRRASAAAATRGLDAEVIETFPMFQYSEVKALKIGKGALECAVCLNEFEDDETLRLIPKCDHVFHPQCIDPWLGSHLTCPVCRANLVPLPGESTHFHPPESQLAEPDNTDNQANGNAVSIVVEEHREVNNVDGGGQLRPRPWQEQPVVRNISFNQNRPPRSSSVRTRLLGKFRSHSTGHSLVQRGENLERFTLRLPEEVRKEIINRAVLKRTGSLAMLPKASSSRRGYRTGESSSSSIGRSYGMLEPPDRLEVRSDRWIFSMAPPFFSRASSVRLPKVVADNGGGSTTSRTPKGGLSAVKLPLNCLEPKGSDETGLVSADSGRLPV